MQSIIKTNHGELIQGDNLDAMKTIKDNSIDSCISDFPYDLAFMGKKWDNMNNFYQWCKDRSDLLYNKIKSGGYVMIFGHAKTNHRMKCAFEDSGFIVVDEIDWLYMTGMPKSQDIGKLFDKKAGVSREIVGVSNRHNSRAFGEGNGEDNIYGNYKGGIPYVTAPTSELAKIWDGWKTSGLKPAKEPITIFQKPLEGTYCENIEKYNCGAMNIDVCRIPTSQEDKDMMNKKASKNPTTNYSDSEDKIYGAYAQDKCSPANELGRFPLNIISFNEELWFDKWSNPFPQWTDRELSCKCKPKEKILQDGSKNTHVTVKPINLIKWLIKLVTPIHGTTIDITAGSGTHGVACEELNKEEGYNLTWLNIEMLNTEKEPYCNIAKKRIEQVAS